MLCNYCDMYWYAIMFIDGYQYFCFINIYCNSFTFLKQKKKIKALFFKNF